MYSVTSKLPTGRVDRFAMIIFLIGSPLCIWYEAFVVIPSYHQSNPSNAIPNYLLVVFFAVSIFGNFLQLMLNDSSTAHVVLPTVITPDLQAQGWKYCYFCQMNAPPRSHHCLLCKTCILRREGHCFFAGKCAGNCNIRYYIVMSTYCWLAAIYYNWYNLGFLHSVLGPEFDFLTVLCLVAPHVGLFLKRHSLLTFGVSILTHIGLFCLVIFSAVAVPLLIRVLTGQTKYERKNNDRSYSFPSISENLVEVFGKRYFLVWLFPFIPSPLPTDGLSFRRLYLIKEL